MGLCEEDNILIKNLWVQRLWSEETDKRNSNETMEEDYFEQFFEKQVSILYELSV